MPRANNDNEPEVEPRKTFRERLSTVWSWVCALIFLAIFMALIVTITEAIFPASVREWKPPQEYAVWIAITVFAWLLARLIEKRFDEQAQSLSALHDRLRKSDELLASIRWQAEDDRRKIAEQLTRIEWALDPLLRALDK